MRNTSKVAPDGITRDKVRVLAIQGLSRNEISAALGISTQAVHYHLHRLRELGELPQEPAA